jgi:hypothetical protein
MAQRREGRWLCPSCGRENLGRYEACEEGCGAARPKGVRFYLPENTPILTDPALLADAASGQDWYCDHCDGANPSAHEGRKVVGCAHCGEPRTDNDPSHGQTTYAKNQTPRTHAALKAIERLTEPRWEKRKRKGKTGHFSSTLGMFALICLVVLFVSALTASFVYPSGQIDARVDAFAWQRSISIEALQTERKEGWSLPIGARKISQETRVKEVIDVPDGTRETDEVCGQTDLGNGYFEDIPCTEIIYQQVDQNGTWYQYDIDQWTAVRTIPANGADRTAYWPDINPAENERIGIRSEAYHVRVKLSDGSYQIHEVGQATWMVLDIGWPVTIYTNWWGGNIGIEFPDGGKTLSGQ